MKIAIPTILSTKRMVGVAEYLKNLIEHLQEIDNKNEYYIITFKQNRYLFKLWNKNFHEITIHVFDFSRIFLRINYFLWQKFYFLHFVKKNKIDLVHFPCPWILPPKIKSIVTFHDLVEFHINKYGKFNNMIKQKVIRSSIKNANKIISVSQNTREDLIKLFKIESTTIYNGVNKNNLSFDTILINEVMKKYNLKNKEYFLFIGTLQHHKNILNIVEAFKIFLGKKWKFELVIIGKKDNAFRDIKRKIKRNHLIGNIKILGYISEKEKYIILQEAKCLLYTSFYEGFGFPILDAQIRKIPVITSNTSAMPEIAGKGALLVNPEKPDDIARAMCLIDSNIPLKENLILKGYDNINRFSWERNAKEVIKFYRSTL